MLDVQVYQKSIAQDTILSVDAIGAFTKTVQSRPNPRLMGAAILGGADAQHGKLDAPALPSVGLIIPSKENPLLKMPGYQLRQKDELNPQMFQDSAGAQISTLLLLMAYEQAIQMAPNRNAVAVIVDITTGANALGTAVEITGLDASKNYQIISYYNIGAASGLFVLFDNPDFRGLRPGGPLLGTDVKQNQLIEFPIGDVPQFSGANKLTVSGWGTAAAANKLFINMIEL